MMTDNEKKCGQCKNCLPVSYCGGDCECVAKSEPRFGYFFEVSEEDEIEWYGEKGCKPCPHFEEVHKMDVKRFFEKDLRGVKILSQIGYEKPVFFDKPELLDLSERQAKLWKANNGELRRVDCVLYTIKYEGQFYAEYESERHALYEIKRLAEAARNGDRIFKFSHECELENRERLSQR